MKQSTNKTLNSIVKLRHLKVSLKNNWELLEKIRNSVVDIIDDAKRIMATYGSDQGKVLFVGDIQTLNLRILSVQDSLTHFSAFIKSNAKIDGALLYEKFSNDLLLAGEVLTKISAYPESSFINLQKEEWREIWDVIKSNVNIVQSIGEAAYLRFEMINKFSKEEVDELTLQIVKHIPESFNILDANKYKDDYLEAMRQIAEEANKKDNLWDRFLNLIAGNIPFKQTPEERVMMMRWLDGEKGEL